MKAFLLDAAERAAKTFFQTFAGLASAGSLADWKLGWREWLITAGTAAVISLLTSAGSFQRKGTVSPASLVEG